MSYIAFPEVGVSQGKTVAQIISEFSREHGVPEEEILKELCKLPHQGSRPARYIRPATADEVCRFPRAQLPAIIWRQDTGMVDWIVYLSKCRRHGLETLTVRSANDGFPVKKM